MQFNNILKERLVSFFHKMIRNICCITELTRSDVTTNEAAPNQVTIETAHTQPAVQATTQSVLGKQTTEAVHAPHTTAGITSQWSGPAEWNGGPPIMYFSFESLDGMTTHGNPALMSGKVCCAMVWPPSSSHQKKSIGIGIYAKAISIFKYLGF